jgi:GAF domain-containing protein
VGVLDLQSRVGGSLSQDDLAAFEALAGQLAIAIQNANLLAEAEQARFEVEAQARKLVRAGWQEYLDGVHQPENLGFVFVGDQVIPQEKTTVVEGTNEKDVLTAPISISSENLGALTVEMAERKRSAQAEQLTFAVARQVAQHIENLRLLESAERYRAQAEQASRRIIREGWQEYATSNVEKMLSYDYDLNEVRTSAPDKQQPEESGIALPLKVREEPVGKIVIHDLVSEDHDALALAQTIAERLSTHIENLRLFEQTRDRAQREQALRQITNAVRGSTDPATILRSAARELGTLLRRKTVIRMATSNPGSASSPLAGQAVNDTKDDVTAAQASQDTAGGVE